jgi:hypothetical protein
MAHEYTPLLRWQDEEQLSTERRYKVLARAASCRCGCGGEDSWHKWWFTRVVRNIVVHPEPVEATSYAVEVARGTVRLPWADEPVPVRAMVRKMGEDTLSRYADWELVELRGA